MMDPHASLEFIVSSVLSDGVLHPDERAFVIAKGIELGLARATAEQCLQTGIDRHGSVRQLPDLDRPAPDDVEAYVQRSPSLILNESGVVEFEVRNGGRSRLLDVELAVSSKPPVDYELESFRRSVLEPGQRLRAPVSIVPRVAGQNLLKVIVRFRTQGGSVEMYVAYLTVDVAQRPPTSPGHHIQVEIKAERVMGVDMSRLVAVTPEPSPAAPERQTPSWCRIDLEKADSAERSLVHAGTCVGGWLVRDGDGPARRIRLVPDGRVLGGRATDSNDIPLVFTPATPANIERSASISRRHIELALDGRRWWLRSLSQGRTTLNGQDIDAGHPVPLAGGARITVGAHGLPVSVLSVAAEPSLALHLRVDNESGMECCALPHGATVCATADGDLRIGGVAGDTGAASIEFSRGRFLIRARSSDVTADGQHLRVNEDCEMRDGATLSLGASRWRFVAVRHSSQG